MQTSNHARNSDSLDFAQSLAGQTVREIAGIEESENIERGGEALSCLQISSSLIYRNYSGQISSQTEKPIQ